MAKENKIIENTINQTLDDIVSDRFGSYSKYIIQERALPDVRDGLKPVQRRILYSMYVDNNTSDHPFRKSAKTVGSVMGNYHPHGDSSIYEAMVRLSQDWKVNLPLVTMHGNNGSIDDDPPAAMRYTEARLSKNAELLLNDIDYKCVPFTNNYDDTLTEPTVLPSSIPLLLINGSTGIASGYATNIAPHNFNEVIDACIYRLSNPNCSIEDLMAFIQGPDFPTGGIVSGLEQIKEVFKTGKGKVVIKSKCEIINNKNGSQIIVSEIPYEVIKADLVKNITNISLSKEIDGISSVADESGRNGLRIVIDIKANSDPNLILNYLYKKTDLQINYSYNCVAIVNHSPVTLSLSDFIDSFINFRRKVVKDRSIYLYEKKKARLHIIEGLIKAISILDDVIAIIRKSKDKKDAIENLIKAFLFTNEQADAIVSLRLYRLSNTDIVSLKEENKQLLTELAELRAIIDNKDVLDLLICKELRKVNEEFKVERKTKIEEEYQEIVIDKVSLINSEDCYISVSKDGYLKRYSSRSYMANSGLLPTVKENDKLLGIKQVNTLDTLLLFTNMGNIAYVPIHKIPEAKFKDLGKHVSSLVSMASSQKIVGAIVVKDFNTLEYVVTTSKQGMIKKTSLPKMGLSRTSKEVVGMKLKDNDELIAVKLCLKEDDILIITRDGFANRFNSEVLADVSSKSMGVKGINVKNDDEVKSLLIYHNDNNDLLLSSTSGGFKRMHFNTIPYTSRASKGTRLFKYIKSKPLNLKQASVVNSFASIILIESESKTIPVSSIPFMDKEASFSSTIDVKGDYYYLNNDQNDIEEAIFIPLPIGYQKEEVDTKEDQITLF